MAKETTHIDNPTSPFVPENLDANVFLVCKGIVS